MVQWVQKFYSNKFKGVTAKFKRYLWGRFWRWGQKIIKKPQFGGRFKVGLWIHPCAIIKTPHVSDRAVIAKNNGELMSNHPDTNETNENIALELTKLIINNPQSQNNLRLTKELKDNPKDCIVTIYLDVLGVLNAHKV